MCKNGVDDLRDGVQVVNCAKDSHVELSEQRNFSYCTNIGVSARALYFINNCRWMFVSVFQFEKALDFHCLPEKNQGNKGKSRFC